MANLKCLSGHQLKSTLCPEETSVQVCVMTAWLSTTTSLKCLHIAPLTSLGPLPALPSPHAHTHTHRHSHVYTQTYAHTHASLYMHMHTCARTYRVECWAEGRWPGFCLEKGICDLAVDTCNMTTLPFKAPHPLSCLAPDYIQDTWGPGCALWSLKFSTGCIFPCKLIRHYLHPPQLRRERFWTLAFYSRLCFSFTFAY